MPKRTLSKGILHLHCHDKSLGGHSHEREWMQRCFDSLEEPEAGCCGMAGSFGMRKQTRHLGQTLFSRHLKPAIDSMDIDAVIVANGFSCHEQITDYGKQRILHPVQVLEECL